MKKLSKLDMITEKVKELQNEAQKKREAKQIAEDDAFWLWMVETDKVSWDLFLKLFHLGCGRRDEELCKDEEYMDLMSELNERAVDFREKFNDMEK